MDSCSSQNSAMRCQPPRIYSQWMRTGEAVGRDGSRLPHYCCKDIACKQKGPGLLCLAIAVLTTRVRAPDKDDWEKLCHLLEYLRNDHAWSLVFGAENNGQLLWYVAAWFAMHPNMCDHTGRGLTMGRGFPITASAKQKLNTRSSPKSELVGVDDMMPIITWTCYFLLSQGYGIIRNLLLQDNESSILLKRK